MSEIEKWLPHRPPFLFVDTVRLEGDKIHGSRLYTADEWFFKGHFPAYPVVPGVLLVETMAQIGGVGVKMMGVVPKGLFVLARIRGATFRRQVRPGDMLDVEIENLRATSQIIHQKGTGRVAGDIVIEAEWVSMATGVPE